MNDTPSNLRNYESEQQLRTYSHHLDVQVQAADLFREQIFGMPPLAENSITSEKTISNLIELDPIGADWTENDNEPNLNPSDTAEQSTIYGAKEVGEICNEGGESTDRDIKTVDKPGKSSSTDPELDVISYPDGSSRKLFWDGDKLRSMVTSDGQSWERQKQNNEYVDRWTSNDGKVWLGSVTINQSNKDVSLAEQGYPKQGSQLTIHANGDSVYRSSDGSMTAKFADSEVVSVDSSKLMKSYLAADGTLREFSDWHLDFETGELQPTSMRITEGKEVSTWKKQGDIWTVDGSPSTMDFKVDSKNLSYSFTDKSSGQTTKLVAGRYEETNQYIGNSEYLTRTYNDGTRSLHNGSNWTVNQNEHQQSTAITNGGKRRIVERDSSGQVSAVIDGNSRKWHKDTNGSWMIEDGGSQAKKLEGDLYVDARGLCIFEKSDGSLHKLDGDGNLVSPSKSERLRALAEKSSLLSPEVKSAFAENTEIFQNRSKIGKDEVEKSIDNVSRLFSNSGNGPFNQLEKEVMAAQLIWHLAHPSRQEQGGRLTCNVTAIRGCLIAETPSEFARMIADVGLNGSFVTADGTTVTPPPASLKLQPAGIFPPSDGDNSWLGQISDQTMVNIFWQRQTADSHQQPVNKGEIVYEQWSSNANDTGERLFKVTGDKRVSELMNRDNQFPARHPNLYAGDIGDIYGQITGKDESVRIVTNTSIQRAAPQKANFVSSETEFEAALTTGPWPKIVAVHTSQSPFYEDSEMGSAGGAGGRQGGWHVVVVKGYEPKSKLISVDNSWAPEKDHTDPSLHIPLSTLYRATQGPK